MSPSSSSSTPASTASGGTISPPLLPLLVLLFVGSGCAALIYEIVWFQLLQLIVGSSAASMAVVLATFMGGMCAGSVLLPKYIKPDHHPLRVYAKLEIAIGILGIIILFGLPLTGGLYTMIGGSGLFGVFTRALFCAIWLLPPTILMGATLPAISRWVETTPKGVSWLGFFYGGNIAGAVVGGLVAGFYLLRVHDMTVTTFVAVGINFLVGFAGMQLANHTSYTPTPAKTVAEEAEAEAAMDDGVDRRPIYIAIGLSGLTALAAEGVWTRLVTLLLGGTTYTFSIILGAVLIGLGIGSTVGATLERSLSNPRLALAWCQLLLVATLGYAAYMLMAALPYWPINPGLSSSPWFTLQIDFVRALTALLPASILWGASFPLALGSVARRGEDPGRLVGRVYAANTLGAIIGAILGTVVLIPTMGTQNAQRLLMAIAAASAIIAFLAAYPKGSTAGYALSAVSVVAAGLFAVGTPQLPMLLVEYGRYSATRYYDHGDSVFVGEGMNSSMAVSRSANGVLNYHNAGKVQASSEPQDMRLQRMLGHLTTLLPTSKNQEILVIGCGAGVTAGATSVDPDVAHVHIAEIEKLVPYTVSKYFGEQNFNVVDNPKTIVHIDDARHFLLTTNQKFDAITSDPFDPWVKGAATLYSKEFFLAAKDHLNEGGVVTVFVQLYEAGTEAVKSEIATFFQAFPNAIVFANTYQGQGYDVVLVGQKTDGPIDVDRIQAKLSDPKYAKMSQSLAEIGMNNAIDLLGTFSGRGSMLRSWLADAQVNTDHNLRLQYLAGLGVNAYEQVNIQRELEAGKAYPEDLFKGSPETLGMLKSAIMGGR